MKKQANFLKNLTKFLANPKVEHAMNPAQIEALATGLKKVEQGIESAKFLKNPTIEHAINPQQLNTLVDRMNRLETGVEKARTSFSKGMDQASKSFEMTQKEIQKAQDPSRWVLPMMFGGAALTVGGALGQYLTQRAEPKIKETEEKLFGKDQESKKMKKESGVKDVFKKHWGKMLAGTAAAGATAGGTAIGQ